MKNRPEFLNHLAKAEAFHGHLCAGQIIGVRIAMLGIKLLGITDPLGTDRKKLMVFVEIDRCATDAIMTVTGCRVGRRSMKVIDNGKMAATFFNIETGRAVRIVSRQDAREKAMAAYPDHNETAAQMQAYREMADSDLFRVMDVDVSIRNEDMPGKPTGKACCESCGETILDKREMLQDGRILCRPCATGKSYYTTQQPQCHRFKECIPL